MQDWERKRLEYRPPTPPKRELLGDSSGLEIGKQVEELTLEEVPDILKQALASNPVHALEHIEDTKKVLESKMDELAKCLHQDEMDGVPFDVYKSLLQTPTSDLTGEDYKKIETYENGHLLKTTGKTQAIAYKKLHSMKKEVDFFQQTFEKIVNKKPNETLEQLEEKKENDLNSFITEVIQNPDAVASSKMKRIANETKISFIIEERLHDIMEVTDEVERILLQDTLEQTSHDPEKFVFRLGSAGRKNVDTFKNIQDKAFEGNAYHLMSTLDTIEQQSSSQQYEEILSSIMAVSEEIEKVSDVMSWMETLPEQEFEYHNPLGVLLHDTIESISVADIGLNDLHVNLSMLTRVSRDNDHAFLESFANKQRNHVFKNILDTMQQFYPFEQNSRHTASDFVKVFGLDKPKNICGTFLSK